MSYSANQAFKKKTERKADLILYSSDMINENRGAVEQDLEDLINERFINNAKYKCP